MMTINNLSEQKALEAYPPHYQKLAGDGYFDMSLEKREGYIKGYDQAMQDFMEKACEWLMHNNNWHDGEVDFYIKSFKNYMQSKG